MPNGVSSRAHALPSVPLHQLRWPPSPSRGGLSTLTAPPFSRACMTTTSTSPGSPRALHPSGAVCPMCWMPKRWLHSLPPSPEPAGCAGSAITRASWACPMPVRSTHCSRIAPCGCSIARGGCGCSTALPSPPCSIALRRHPGWSALAASSPGACSTRTNGCAQHWAARRRILQWFRPRSRAMA